VRSSSRRNSAKNAGSGADGRKRDGSRPRTSSKTAKSPALQQRSSTGQNASTPTGNSGKTSGPETQRGPMGATRSRGDVATVKPALRSKPLTLSASTLEGLRLHSKKRTKMHAENSPERATPPKRNATRRSKSRPPRLSPRASSPNTSAKRASSSKARQLTFELTESQSATERRNAPKGYGKTLAIIANKRAHCYPDPKLRTDLERVPPHLRMEYLNNLTEIRRAWTIAECPSITELCRCTNTKCNKLRTFRPNGSVKPTQGQPPPLIHQRKYVCKTIHGVCGQGTAGRQFLDTLRVNEDVIREHLENTECLRGHRNKGAHARQGEKRGPKKKIKDLKKRNIQAKPTAQAGDEDYEPSASTNRT